HAARTTAATVVRAAAAKRLRGASQVLRDIGVPFGAGRHDTGCAGAVTSCEPGRPACEERGSGATDGRRPTECGHACSMRAGLRDREAQTCPSTLQRQRMSATARSPTAINANSWRTCGRAFEDTRRL